MEMSTGQSVSKVIMIRPQNFGFDPETAESNAFQTKQPEISTTGELDQKIWQEFDNAVEKLGETGVEVVVFRDRKDPICPDAIFLNNWFSVHREGFIFIYPMLCKARRLEKRTDLIGYLQSLRKFDVNDLSNLATEDGDGHQFLEGTGSIVFDYLKKVAYACRSPRTDEGLVGFVCEKLGYRKVCFNATDALGTPFYHTNVLMWVGTKLIAICIEAIKDEREKQEVLSVLTDSGRQLLFLAYKEIRAFAGNCIELTNKSGDLILAMSATARQGLSEHNWHAIDTAFDKVVICDVTNIERIGGGGIRCMIAGVFV